MGNEEVSFKAYCNALRPMGVHDEDENTSFADAVCNRLYSDPDRIESESEDGEEKTSKPPFWKSAGPEVQVHCNTEADGRVYVPFHKKIAGQNQPYQWGHVSINEPFQEDSSDDLREVASYFQAAACGIETVPYSTSGIEVTDEPDASVFYREDLNPKIVEDLRKLSQICQAQGERCLESVVAKNLERAVARIRQARIDEPGPTGFYASQLRELKKNFAWFESNLNDKVRLQLVTAPYDGALLKKPESEDDYKTAVTAWRNKIRLASILYDDEQMTDARRRTSTAFYQKGFERLKTEIMKSETLSSALRETLECLPKGNSARDIHMRARIQFDVARLLINLHTENPDAELDELTGAAKALCQPPNSTLSGTDGF